MEMRPKTIYPIEKIVARNLEETDDNMGYCSLTTRIRKQTHQSVSSVKIMEVLRNLNPEGVEASKRGKNTLKP
jgi:hypothetical protein